MITISNQIIHDSIPFSEYLALPGYSHSFLKREVGGVLPAMDISEGMQIGSLVDAIITEPGAANMGHPSYDTAKTIAYHLKRDYQWLFDGSKKQVNMTANFTHQGLTLPVKGRADFWIPDHMVIDLKVTNSRDSRAIISHMGYLNPLWGYAKMAGVKKGAWLFYSKPLKKCLPLIEVDLSSDVNAFWMDKIMKFGKVKQEASV
jgi:hypothetical protein